MATINEIKAAFYDLQRQTANIMEMMSGEITELNKKIPQAPPVVEADVSDGKA